MPPGRQYILNCTCALRSRNRRNCMSIALVCFGCILLLITPSAVLLLVWISVFGWGCPISSRICPRYTASFALSYNAPSSASAAEDITALIMVAFVRIVPLFGGNFCHLIRKNVLRLSCVRSFCCSIQRHCGLLILSCSHCM